MHRVGHDDRRAGYTSRAYQVMRLRPAEAMRPKPPEVGRRIPV